MITKECKYTCYMHVFENGKVYIGITSRDVKLRYGKNGVGYISCPRMANAIRKYGWDNIEHIIVATHLSKYEAQQMEIALIQMYKSDKPEYGYNITPGGDMISHDAILRGSAKRKQTLENNPALRNQIVENLRASRLGIPSSNRKRIVGYEVSTGRCVGHFDCIKDATDGNKSRSAMICDCCKGNEVQAYGCVWLYEEDDTSDNVAHRITNARIVRGCKMVAVTDMSDVSNITTSYFQKIKDANRFMGNITSDQWLGELAKMQRPISGYLVRFVGRDEYLRSFYHDVM